MSDMRMFIPDEVRNHLIARRCEKHFLRGSRPDAAIATIFVQSSNFGLGNLGASSFCAAKNKGAGLRGYGTSLPSFIVRDNEGPPTPPPPPRKKNKQQKSNKNTTNQNDRPLREFEHAVKFRRSLNNVFVSNIR